MGQATSSSTPFLIQNIPNFPLILNSNRSELGMGKNGNAHRSAGGGGRSYGLILLLALGAAILGVMVLHKLREGRLFSLLVKEKDHDLLSLHLLLQKERELNKEAQKKLEEMKTNIYSVTSQKSDVEGRLSEVNSLVSSLKDEQKILESQLEEKRIEIKMLKQQQQMPTEEIKFRDTLKQKQGENDNEKSHKEEPGSVWSVSSDDPSNPPMNFTKGETKLAVDKPEDGNLVVMNGKEKKLKRRYRDLIRRFRDGENGNLEQNEVGASRKKDQYVASTKEESLKNGTEEDSKEISNGIDHHVEDGEQTKSTKDEEHKTN